jgi:signal transduction histidine kinase
MATLYRLGKMVTASLDLDATLTAIVEAASQLTGAETSAILLLQSDDSLVIRAGQGPIAAAVGERVQAHASIAGRALRDGRAVLIEDMTGAQDRARPDLDSRSGTRAYLAAPLVWRDEQLGVITVGATRLGALGTSDEYLITELAEQAAAAVAHARAYTDEQARRLESEAVAHELTERTAQMVHLQKQLVQSEKMSAICQLADGIAHEMNTPLGVIISNLSVLQRYGEDLGTVAAAAQETVAELGDHEGPRADLLSAMEQALRAVDLEYTLEDLPQLIQESIASANRATTIIRSLATFARRDPDQFSTVALEGTIDSAVTLAWNALKHRADVVKDFGGVPPVLGHASELTQVFVHLLLNAAEAFDDAAGAITLRTSIDREEALVTVMDTGRGISSELLPRVFDPFFTTHQPGRGTGMGLSLCHGIIARHGGSITLDSEPGQGTTVSVRIPLIHSQSEAA